MISFNQKSSVNKAANVKKPELHQRALLYGIEWWIFQLSVLFCQTH